MAFSEAFLTWERETEGKGRKEGKKEGKKEGRKEGKKEGKKEGRKEERETIALNLLQQGLSIEMIAQVTSLTTDEVQALQTSIGS